MVAKTGARAVPKPSSALSVRIARSTVCGKKAAVNVLSAGTQNPKPTPRQVVAASSRIYATRCAPVANWLPKSNVIDSKSAARPISRTRLPPMRCVSPAPRSEARMAVIACGTNMPPYSVLVRA